MATAANEFSLKLLASRLPLFVREEFAVHRNPDAIALWISNFFDVHCEVDRAHYAGAEFLLYQFLHRPPVDVDDLLKTVLERLPGNRGSCFSFVRKFG